jgi:hypothetical protein
VKGLTTLLAFLLLACTEGPLASYIDPATIQVEFTVRLVGLTDPATTSVEGVAGGIVVHASILTGQHGYELRPTIAADGGLHLLVTAESGAGITIPAHYRYDARLLKLPPGQYALTVVHEVPGERRRITVFQDIVRVR